MIRKFKKEDARKVSNLIRKALVEVNSKDYPPSAIQYLCDEYSPKRLIDASKKRAIFVAAENAKIFGIVGIENNHVFNLFVNPTFHGIGIGTRLMAHAEKIVKNRGYSFVELPSSITADKFYKKLGYKEIEKKRDKNIGEIIILRKEI
ncbi:MAG: GNAT family N-acetyltransferase [Nanoarchaeota archaeon]|nr:GNAT family N-acetyltransferase [Nanoarchaeota archaeon]MBU4300490.1 GNAT family N-acetyltransferase [Nanoarchaeota archaeon]MBU4451970.1 GNAT family N-acetyltransferase [Nanoarchaeota archaeon]MCG2724130.1 GNAT family N-acetyltransferase [archaeon]